MRAGSRCILAAALLSVASSACGPNRNCLRWPRSPIASALVWREHARASASPAPLRARILEALPSLFEDRSGRSDQPTCEPELVDELADDLERRPLRYDYATFHELKALGNIVDTRRVMPAKARILLDLATIDDSEVARYQFAESEIGVEPAPRRLRYLALAVLIRSNLYANDADVREFFAERILAPHDDREQLLLVGAARAIFFGGTLGGTTDPGMRPRIAAAWIHDIERRLAGPPSTLSLGLVLSEWVELASHSDRLGVAGPLRALARRVIDAHGAFPLTRATDGAARDLVVLAILAASGATDQGKCLTQWSPDVPFPSLPGFARTAWALEDPTAMFFAESVAARRLRELDTEIERLAPIQGTCIGEAGLTACFALHRPWGPFACSLLRERATLTPVADEGRFYDKLLSVDRDSLVCAYGAALRMDGVAADRRARKALEALGPPGIAAMPDYGAIDAAMTIAEHPFWVDRDEALHTWLAREALAEGDAWYGGTPLSVRELEVWLAWRPILNRMVLVDSSSRAPEERQRARAIVARWLDLLQAGPGGAPSVALEDALLLSIVALAPRVGLEREAGSLIAGAFARPDVARWLFGGEAR